jgi:hypothetical protein
MTGYRIWLSGHPNKPDREFYTNEFPSPYTSEDYPLINVIKLEEIPLERLKHLLKERTP